MHIPNPCHENWFQMSSAQQGRHCAQCSTVVMDMTRLSNDEIMTLVKKGSVKCGRFYEDQLTPPAIDKGWLMQSLGRMKKEWVFASMLVMLQLNTPIEVKAGAPNIEQVNPERKLFPIDSGIAMPGFIQGQLLRTDSVPVSNKSVYLYTLSGKRIGTMDTDDKGFFAFALPDGLTEESCRLVFKNTKYKNRRFVYHWHKTKLECKNGEWVEFKIERSKRKRILKKRSVVGCPKFR